MRNLRQTSKNIERPQKPQQCPHNNLAQMRYMRCAISPQKISKRPFETAQHRSGIPL